MSTVTDLLALAERDRPKANPTEGFVQGLLIEAERASQQEQQAQVFAYEQQLAKEAQAERMKQLQKRLQFDQQQAEADRLNDLKIAFAENALDYDEITSRDTKTDQGKLDRFINDYDDVQEKRGTVIQPAMSLIGGGEGDVSGKPIPREPAVKQQGRPIPSDQFAVLAEAKRQEKAKEAEEDVFDRALKVSTEMRKQKEFERAERKDAPAFHPARRRTRTGRAG